MHQGAITPSVLGNCCYTAAPISTAAGPFDEVVERPVDGCMHADGRCSCGALTELDSSSRTSRAACVQL